jgi:hypothetical protein
LIGNSKIGKGYPLHPISMSDQPVRFIGDRDATFREICPDLATFQKYLVSLGPFDDRSNPITIPLSPSYPFAGIRKWYETKRLDTRPGTWNRERRTFNLQPSVPNTRRPSPDLACPNGRGGSQSYIMRSTTLIADEYLIKRPVGEFEKGAHVFCPACDHDGGAGKVTAAKVKS